jgi:hypothetical protein
MSSSSNRAETAAAADAATDQPASVAAAFAATDDSCYDCYRHMSQLNATAGVWVAPSDLPSDWRQACIKCLEEGVTDGRLDMRPLVVHIMATAFLSQQGMPISSAVSYNAAELPPSPEPGVSAVCHSCIINWAAEGSSMDVANDREKMAHCHACLTVEVKGRYERQSLDTLQMVEYGLASRLLGKFILAPAVRMLKHGMASPPAGSSDSSRSKQAGKEGAPGAPAASKPAGKCHSSSSSSSRRLTCSKAALCCCCSVAKLLSCSPEGSAAMRAMLHSPFAGWPAACLRMFEQL